MSHASSSKVCKYGAFLSFRGPDTRRNFVSHLYIALEQRGINVFKDDERVETGKSISNELLKAIEESRFAVVIFSKSYASSRWCLEERAHIIRCRNELDQIVIPIFYDVSPSVVSHQNSPFAESFSQHEERYKDDMEKVQRWKEACKEAGKIAGDEADCIKEVVDYILPNVVSPFSESLVGTQIDKVISLLHMKSDDICSVGIWGMSGIGKTEIASVIYERYRHQFEAYCFLGDVGEMYHKKGLIWLQKTLIRKLLGKKMTVTSERDGTIIIKNELLWKKVLLILDNVDHLSQLELIVGGTEWFGRGSRILITTRDKHLIISHVKKDKVYEVLLLSENEALELFCMHAFKRKSPDRNFEELSSEVVKYADGLPLALKVLGSSVYGRNIEQCRDIIDRLKKIPNDDILGKLKIGLDGLNKDERRIFLDIACLYNHCSRYYVQRILESCDINFIGIDRLIEKSLLSTRYGDMFEMHSLISQMGQNVSREEYTNTRIWLTEEVHDLFAGKLKTKKVESLLIPRGYRFEDDHVNHSKVFKRLQSLQVLIVDETICSEITVTCFPSSLRWIEWPNYQSSSLPENFEPSQLVRLRLNRSRLVELWPIPKKLSNLKHLDLSESLGLKKTPNFGDMPNLEKLDLWGCSNLEEVHPSLGRCRILTDLSLYGCVKLKKLPKFFTMESLETLNLKKCTSLEDFPEIYGDMRCLSKLCVGSHQIRSLPPSLSGLRILELIGCNKLAMLPNSIFESHEQLEDLCIRECSGLVELPIYLEVQKMLRRLEIDGCENLNNLPSSFQMESLKQLEISNCPKFDTFPEINGDMHCLQELTLNSTGIRELPSSIGNLRGLEYLDLIGCEELVSLPNNLCNLKNLRSVKLDRCKKLEKLPSSFQMESLVELKISNCPKFDSFPEINGDMHCLQKLTLNSTGIRELPSSIGNLMGLEYLDLNGCEELLSLPNSLCNLKNFCSVKLDRCKKLEKLPSSFQMESLVELKISNCPKFDSFPEINGDMHCLQKLTLNSTGIRELPSSIGNLMGLEYLDLIGCEELVSLPNNLCNLKNLRSVKLDRCKKLEKLPSSFQMESLVELKISNCPKFDSFPEINGDMHCLQKLTLNSTGIRELPSSIGNLMGLEYLDLNGCEELVSLPNSLCNLKNLRSLNLDRCKKLEKLPSSFQMESLVELKISNCPKFDSFPEINGDMHCLQKLTLNSTGIRELPSSIGNLMGLEYLDLNGCEELVSLPNSLCNLKNLRSLNLDRCKKLEKLPSSFQMESLVELKISNCPKFDSFPEINGDMHCLQKLTLNSTGIRELPSSIGNLMGLEYLDLNGCEELVSLPNSLCNLKNLRSLNLDRCKKLEKLPSSFQMESLVELKISNCPKFDSFPEINGDMHCLQKLTLNSTGIRELPSSIGNLRGLEYLDLNGCEELVSLPNSLCNLKNLRSLNLDRCKKLEKLSENIGDLQEFLVLDVEITTISQLHQEPYF